jgi:hypothetical protein
MLYTSFVYTGHSDWETVARIRDLLSGAPCVLIA